MKLPKNAIRRGPPELILVLEMISDQRVVNAGPVCDIARRCAFEAILRESLDRSIKQFLLCDYAALLLFTRRLFNTCLFCTNRAFS